MKDQHEKITGYRDLSQKEIDLMNKIKQKGIELQELIYECRGVDVEVGKTGEAEHDEVLDEASRWRSIAKTQLQQGLMALTRSVAKPTTF